MNKLDEYIKENFLLEYIIKCNSLPSNLKKNVEIRNHTDISSKWKRIVICKNEKSFSHVVKLFRQHDILFKTTIEKKKTLLAAIINEDRSTSFSAFIIWGSIKWTIVISLCILMPLYALKFTALGSWSKIRAIIMAFIKN